MSSVYNYKPEEIVVAEASGRNGCCSPPRVNQRRAADLICLGSYIDTPQKRGIRGAILSTSILATLWIHRDTPVITRGAVPQPNPAPINTFVLGLSDLEVTTNATVTGQGKEISERKERERGKKREERKISWVEEEMSEQRWIYEGKTILRLRAKRGYNSPILIRDNTGLDFCTF